MSSTIVVAATTTAAATAVTATAASAAVVRYRLVVTKRRFQDIEARLYTEDDRLDSDTFMPKGKLVPVVGRDLQLVFDYDLNMITDLRTQNRAVEIEVASKGKSYVAKYRFDRL